MKIVYLILGTFNSGGMERVLCNKTNWLVDRGNDIYIITTDQQERASFFDFSSAITHYDLGINYTDNTNCGFIHKALSYTKKQRLHRIRLEKLLCDIKADIVISMFGTEVGFAHRIKDGSAKILEIHFSKYFRLQQARGGLWWMADKWRSIRDERHIKKYNKFIVLTNEDKEYWGAYHNIDVIYNASTFHPSAQASLDTKRVISVGRLTYQKGYDMLIDTWKAVNEKYPDWTLTIVGSGEELEDRQAQILRLGLESSIEILAPTTMIEKEYLSSSIYVMSSRYEGLPMVLLEAMMCGVPAVCFECKCGPRDVISDGEDGILVPQNDIKALACGICSLMKNGNLRRTMGSRASEKVRQKFSEENIMNQWVDLFNKIDVQ